MAMFDTMYSEKERVATAKQLDAFGINPFAFWLLIESYIPLSPLPVKYVWYAHGKDATMDKAAESQGVVELYITNAGYVGKKLADISRLDILAMNLVCQSYYYNMRPLPVSFTLLNAIGIDIRTPGQSDFDKYKKNPFRERFIEKAMKKK